MRQALAIGLALLLPITATAQEIRGTLSAPGLAGEFVLRPTSPAPSRTPTSTRTPAPTPTTTVIPMPTRCLQGTLDRLLADTGSYGVDNIAISEGEVHTYCIPLPVNARQLLIQEYDQCLGANVFLRLHPFPGARFGDEEGEYISIQEARSSIRLGSTRDPVGYIPAGLYLLQVFGRSVGTGCAGNRSKYDLRWTFLR